MSYPQWLGLLKWSLAQTDGTSESDFSQMTEENKKWLEEVMKEMVKDEPHRLSEILTTFSEIVDRGIKSEDEGQIVDLLEEAHDMIDQIDMANIFVKFGGIKALLGFLNCGTLSDNAKCIVCVICGELSQNNPSVQEAMLMQGVLDQLCVVCASDVSPKLCDKTLYAISCVIRGYSPGEARFCTELTGHVLLNRILLRGDMACSKRVFFLSNALVMSDFTSPTRIEHISNAVLSFCISMLHRGECNSDTCDICLQLLMTLSESSSGHNMLVTYKAQLEDCLNYMEANPVELDSDDTEWISSERQRVAGVISTLRERIKKGPPPVTHGSGEMTSPNEAAPSSNLMMLT